VKHAARPLKQPPRRPWQEKMHIDFKRAEISKQEDYFAAAWAEAEAAKRAADRQRMPLPRPLFSAAKIRKMSSVKLHSVVVHARSFYFLDVSFNPFLFCFCATCLAAGSQGKHNPPEQWSLSEDPVGEPKAIRLSGLKTRAEPVPLAFV
jgi:hypothetical protein